MNILQRFLGLGVRVRSHRAAKMALQSKRLSTCGGLAIALAAGLLLFLLGAFFRFSGLRRYKKDLIQVCVVRLLVMPALLLTAGYLLGIRDAGFAGLISVFASATAIASFTMTQQMGGDSELAGDIVVATSALCIVTMFGWSLLFRQLGAF